MNLQLSLCAPLLLSAPALAGDFAVTITGTVTTNSLSGGPFAGAVAGDAFSASFEVFTPGSDLIPGVLIEYPIDLPTFVLEVGGVQMGPSTTISPPAFCLQESSTDGALIDPAGLAEAGHSMQYLWSIPGGGVFDADDFGANVGFYDVNATPIGTLFFRVSFSGGQLNMTPADLEIEALGFEQFCFGDGGDQMGCTDCPCMNEAPVGTLGGCLNSAGQSATLSGSNTSSVVAADLRFEMTGGNVTTFGVLTSGDNRLPNMGACPPGSGIDSVNAPLDGLRCIGGGLVRHGSRATDAMGSIGVTNNGWGPPNGPAGGIAAQGGFAAGQTRQFQVFYREDDTLSCMNGQNTSCAVSVTFVP